MAWLSLDTGDNDPVRFWRHVAAALDGVHAGVVERVGPLVPGAAGTPFAGVVTALVNEFAAAADEVVLVIDDYHLVEAPEVHRSMEFLLDHLPPAAAPRAGQPQRPAAAARPAAGARPARRAPRGRPALHRRARPRELLRTEVGAHLTDPVVAALGERTEGWAAGLHLAALSLRGRGDVTRFVAEFSGSHRFVLDYLTEEVLERQPAELRTFLLETSILDRLCGPLCDAVVGRPDGQQLLESVERASLFLIPLDEERRWWRYHHLFADLLRANLQAPAPATACRSCTARRRRGTTSTACPTTPSGTRWPAATPPARPSSSRSTSRSRSGGAPRAPRSPPGSPRSRPRRSTAGRC